MIGIILQGGDWEALYINRKLISEDHSLEDPNDWIRWTKTFDLEGVKYVYMQEEDEDNVIATGNMLENLDDYIGHYE